MCYYYNGCKYLLFMERKKITKFPREKKRHLLVKRVTHPQAATLSTRLYLHPRPREPGFLPFLGCGAEWTCRLEGWLHVTGWEAEAQRGDVTYPQAPGTVLVGETMDP